MAHDDPRGCRSDGATSSLQETMQAEWGNSTAVQSACPASPCACGAEAPQQHLRDTLQKRIQELETVIDCILTCRGFKVHVLWCVSLGDITDSFRPAAGGRLVEACQTLLGDPGAHAHGAARDASGRQSDDVGCGSVPARYRGRRELWPDNKMIEQVEESRRKALAAFEQVHIACQTERRSMEADGCNVAHLNAQVEILSSRLRDIDAEKARLTSHLQDMQRELEASRSEIEILAALELKSAPPSQSNKDVPIEVLQAIAFVGGSHLAPVEHSPTMMLRLTQYLEPGRGRASEPIEVVPAAVIFRSRGK